MTLSVYMRRFRCSDCAVAVMRYYLVTMGDMRVDFCEEFVDQVSFEEYDVIFAISSGRHFEVSS